MPQLKYEVVVTANISREPETDWLPAEAAAAICVWCADSVPPTAVAVWRSPGTGCYPQACPATGRQDHTIW